MESIPDPWQSDAQQSSILALRDGTNASNESCPVCVSVRAYTIPHSHVRPFDIVMLVPNFFFLVYLLIKCRPTAKKLVGSLVLFKILYAVTFIIPVSGIIDAVVSMAVGQEHSVSKVFNVLCRSSVLLTELNVILFGVFFKFYNNQWRRLAATIVFIVCISLANAAVQLTFAFKGLKSENISDCRTTVPYYGSWYGFAQSIVFSMLYCVIFILYVTRLYARWNLPSKKSFYRYTFFLMCLNLFQAVGNVLSGIDAKHEDPQMIGQCITLVSSILYNTSVAPVVYWIFLRNYYRMNISSNATPGPPPVPPAEDINISRASSFNKGSSVIKSTSINRGPSINNISSMKRTDSKVSNARLYCQEQAALLSNDEGSIDSNSSFGSIDEEDEGVKLNATKVSS